MSRLILLFSLVLWLSNCSSEEPRQDYIRLLPHEGTPVFKAQLQSELNNDPYGEGFGPYLALEMNKQNEIFVTDEAEKSIHRINQEGEEISVFRVPTGRGPQEVLSLAFVLDEDEHIAGLFDPAQRRITLMDTGFENFIRTVSYKDYTDAQISMVRVIGFTNEGILYEGLKSLTLFNADEERELYVYFQEYDEEEPELLLTLPPDEKLFVVNEQRRSTSLLYKPIGRRVSLTKYNNELIYISNDGFGYTVYDTDGQFVKTDSLDHDYTAYRFNEDQMENHIMSQIYPNFSEDAKRDLIRAQREALNPDKSVWFRDSFVDVQGRLWFELYPELFSEETRWMVWDRTLEDFFQVVFDQAGVRPQNALNNVVVAFKLNEFDMEMIRVYTF